MGVVSAPRKGPIELATNRSIRKAHDEGRLTPMDEGALATLRWLAGKMDRDEDTNPRLTANSYAGLAAQLGLTVLGRERIAQATGVPTEQTSPKVPDARPARDDSEVAMDELSGRRNSRTRFVPDTG